MRHPALRWGLILILLGLIFWQLWNRSNHFNAFDTTALLAAGPVILVVFCLMPVNWILETLKWRQFIGCHVKVPFRHLLRAVLGGVALSLFTPNRIGEYGGRIIYLPYEIRWPVAISTMMGSVIQNLVAVSAGFISLSFLLPVPDIWRYLAFGFAGFSIFIFFKIKWIVRTVCQWRWHSIFGKVLRQLQYMEDYNRHRQWKAAGLALIRYIVYMFQFAFLLYAFEPGTSLLLLIAGVSALYVFHTIVPLPPVADVLARTNVALMLWSGTGMSELSISLASLMVWIINLLIPALIGSIALSTPNPEKSLLRHVSHFSPAYKSVVIDSKAGTDTRS